MAYPVLELFRKLQTLEKGEFMEIPQNSYDGVCLEDVKKVERPPFHCDLFIVGGLEIYVSDDAFDRMCRNEKLNGKEVLENDYATMLVFFNEKLYNSLTQSHLFGDAYVKIADKRTWKANWKKWIEFAKKIDSDLFGEEDDEDIA